MATTWVYKNSEPGLYTVGFYEPSGKWVPESDHPSHEDAAKRVHYLNGGVDDDIKTLVGTAMNQHVSTYHSSEA